MTIASEISRLQTAKSCLKASIINKGVSVGDSVSLSCYYKCVDEIPTGSGYNIDVLVVGGGGSGGWSKYINSSNGYPNGGGGGGGGGVIEILKGSFGDFYGNSVCVQVGCASGWCNRGCDSYFGGLKACGGGKGGRGRYSDPGNDGSTTGGSGGGGGTCPGAGNKGCPGISGQGYAGADARPGQWAGGGGGAGGPAIGCNGGIGYLSCITGTPTYYGGGGGGGGHSNDACSGIGGCGGGGPGAYCGGVVNNKCGTYYGGGGGGATKDSGGGPGYQGIVIVRYPTDGSYGFTTATGGNSCITCNGYKIHCFTSNGTFTIVS